MGMLLGEIFERFVEQSPTTVMVRGVLEKVLAPEKLDELFERTAKVQYTRELLFSAVVNLAEEIQATYRGMMIAIPPGEWGVFSQMTLTQFSSILQH